MQARVAMATPTSGARRSFARIIDVLGRVPLSAIQLLSRLAIGSVFLKSGLVKIASWQTTVQLFADEYKVPLLPPDVAARMSATFELGCSFLLIVGLATRLATLPLLGMIAVIQVFVYPDAYAEHLTWASLLILLLIRGGGRWALDRVLGLEPGEPAGR